MWDLRTREQRAKNIHNWKRRCTIQIVLRNSLGPMLQNRKIKEEFESFFYADCTHATFGFSQKHPMSQELRFRSQNVALVVESMCIVVGPGECESIVSKMFS